MEKTTTDYGKCKLLFVFEFTFSFVRIRKDFILLEKTFFVFCFSVDFHFSRLFLLSRGFQLKTQKAFSVFSFIVSDIFTYNSPGNIPTIDMSCNITSSDFLHFIHSIVIKYLLLLHHVYLLFVIFHLRFTFSTTSFY